MRIYSCNVNGIRALYNKGEFFKLFEEEPEIVCIQETKAQAEQLSEELLNINGYSSFFESADKKGYSGVAVYSKKKPLAVKKFDIEKDKLHSRKKKRPLASGKISKKRAIVISILMLLGSLLLNYFTNMQIINSSLYLLIIYILTNILYSFGLKNIAIIDIVILTLGCTMGLSGIFSE